MLEQNPRTFLQFSGKVNKGILGTVLAKPEMFFSYNNGISAVAESVDYDEFTNCIRSITNLQIVNGGQTTATIYNSIKTAKNRRIDLHLEKVFVMVKLSVLEDSDKAIEIIPKISEYSNTQNKVATASFSNHHPYHKEMEKYSRNLWTPPIPGVKETHWYYERVLGQYKNAINLCRTKAEKDSFKSNNPQNQMLKPVDWAKIVMTFECKPYTVCLGAQKCYAQFCKEFLKTDDDGNGLIDGSVNEKLFKDTCAKAILFRALEKRISNNIRFVSVPYILATIVDKLKEIGLVFDYEKIWKNQWKNDALFELIALLGEPVIDKLISTMPSDTYSLLSEWGKKVECWNKVKQVQIDISYLKPFCISIDDYRSTTEASRQAKSVDIGINVQSQVIKKGDKYWKNMYLWCEKYMKLSPKEQSILLYATNFKNMIPSERQCRVILDIENRAINEGFI